MINDTVPFSIVFTVLTYDEGLDVLYVKTEHKFVASIESEHDWRMILNKARNGHVVGLQLLNARRITPFEWAWHPEKEHIRDPIHKDVAQWIEANHR